jgi:hypothetical protein
MKDEIESLNLYDIDVEQLERRLELGQMIPIMDDPGVDNTCKDFTCDHFVLPQ